MKSLGIISEFNPFHNGHKYLLDTAKEKLRPDLSISLMSGDFVQRGEASVIDKYTRAKVSVKSGFDMVVEMPTYVSLQAAEFFAKNSIHILTLIGVDYLVFGIENISEKDFLEKTNILINKSSEVDKKIKKLIKTGTSYPKAYADIIYEYVGSNFISSNNILGFEYIKAISKLNSDITPFPIRRIESSNKDIDIRDKTFASSTAIRNNLDSDIKKVMPEESYTELINFLDKYQTFDYNFLYNIFKYKLLIEKYPMDDILTYEQGIENYLKDLALINKSYKDFIGHASSKRYTKARIKRLILNYILDNRLELNDIDPSFIKVLAFNLDSTQYFKKISSRCKLVINKKDYKNLTDQDKLIYKKMIEASNFYSLGIKRKINYDFRHNNRPIVW